MQDESVNGSEHDRGGFGSRHFADLGAGDKLTQIDAALRQRATAVQLGMPAFPGILPDGGTLDH
jgi:hypothetical protein